MALEAVVLSKLLVLDEVSVLVEVSVLEELTPDTVPDGGGGGGGASCWGSMPFSFNTSSTAFLMTVIKSAALLVLELVELVALVELESSESESFVFDVPELSDVVALFDVRKA